MSVGRALVTHHIYSHLSAGILKGGNKDQLFAESEVSLKPVFSLCVLRRFKWAICLNISQGSFSLFSDHFLALFMNPRSPAL